MESANPQPPRLHLKRPYRILETALALKTEQPFTSTLSLLPRAGWLGIPQLAQHYALPRRNWIGVPNVQRTRNGHDTALRGFIFWFRSRPSILPAQRESYKNIFHILHCDPKRRCPTGHSQAAANGENVVSC